MPGMAVRLEQTLAFGISGLLTSISPVPRKIENHGEENGKVSHGYGRDIEQVHEPKRP